MAQPTSSTEDRFLRASHPLVESILRSAGVNFDPFAKLSPNDRFLRIPAGIDIKQSGESRRRTSRSGGTRPNNRRRG